MGGSIEFEYSLLVSVDRWCCAIATPPIPIFMQLNFTGVASDRAKLNFGGFNGSG